MNSSSKERHLSSRQIFQLTWLLRLCGVIDALALLIVFLPSSWIYSLHPEEALGSFPREPVAEYLARSSSLMYAAHGVLLIYLSFQVQKYVQLIRVLAFLAILHGFLLLGIDYCVGMPWWWMILEGPLLLLWGSIILFILSIRPEANTLV